MSNNYEDLDRTVDDLLADRRPRGLEAESPDELDLLKVAALFKAARPGVGDPDPEFVTQLADRLTREQGPQATASPSRRQMLLGGLAGAAASLLAGIGLDRLFNRPDTPVLPPRRDPELVGNLGHWMPVARADKVQPGTVIRVRAGAVESFIMYRDGAIVALTAICTHMPCILSWRREEDDLFCPCHSASFYTDGTFKQGRSPYKPLPPLRVKVEGDMVYLWSVDDVSPSGAG